MKTNNSFPQWMHIAIGILVAGIAFNLSIKNTIFGGNQKSYFRACVDQSGRVKRQENPFSVDEKFSKHYEEIAQVFLLWELFSKSSIDLAEFRNLAFEACILHLMEMSPSLTRAEIEAVILSETEIQLVRIAKAVVKNPAGTVYKLLPLCLARTERLMELDNLLNYTPPTEKQIAAATRYIEDRALDSASLLKPVETWLDRQTK